MIKTRQKIYIILSAILLIVIGTWYVNVYRAQRFIDREPLRQLVASISPIKYLITEIVGGDIEVATLLPAGSSPETYELTPKQIVGLSDAELVFTTGLIDFEKVIVDKLAGENGAKVVNLSKNIDLIRGVCNHGNDQKPEGDHRHNSVDPHIWTSPRCLKIMAANAYEAIVDLYPDSVQYLMNYRALEQKLEELDTEIGQKLWSSGVKYFLIYHPALAYYANDYNIDQIPLEVDGKEPSADYMKYIVEKGKADSVKVILYQKQFNQSVVQTVAKDIGAKSVEFDPLAENVPENLLRITDIIIGR